jgi:FtsH-binding integral membrane protein
MNTNCKGKEKLPMKLTINKAYLINMFCLAIAFTAGGLTSKMFTATDPMIIWQAGALTAWAFVAMATFTYIEHSEWVKRE